MRNKEKSCFLTHDMNNHDMSYHDICHDTCNDNIHTTCIHDMSNRQLSKTDWWYLVNQLTEWRVFAPRAVVKKNPQLAWRIMNICKDPNIRVKGAYFTTCFKRELYKIENAQKIEKMRSWARQKLGIA